MIFDKLCGVVERHFPEHFPMLRDAHLFRMARSSEEGHPTAAEGWEPDEAVIENFRLPFPVVAFEDAEDRDRPGECCTVFQEVVGEARLMRVLAYDHSPVDKTRPGVWRPDLFSEGLLVGLPDGEVFGFRGGPEALDRKYCTFKRLKTYELHGNRPVPLRRNIDDPWRLSISVPKERVLLQALKATNGNAEERARVRDAARAEDPYLLESARQDACIEIMRTMIAGGICRVIVVNTPSDFIVEERPLALKSDVKNKARLLRSQHRPHYIVLKPRAIKTRLLGLSDSDLDVAPRHGTRAPHEVRGHFRRLSSEKFTRARGKVIWIKAHWCGPETAVVGKNRYSVLLDR